MKLYVLLLTVLCLALAAVPAAGQINLYDNGPINGNIDAWTINFGYIVSDTFNISGSATVTGFSFGIWEYPGDTLTSVTWSITSGENSGTVYGAGVATAGGGLPGGGGTLTDKFTSSNEFGYNIDIGTVSGLDVPLGGGHSPSDTYWLNLQNATVPSGDPVYWDENSGKGCGGSGCPSQASDSALGTIPSESFTITGTTGTGTTPEPSSVMLFGSGILGLAGILRRKLFD